MIGTYIRDDGNMRLEIYYSVQLKTAQLQHITIVFIFGNLPGKTLSDVTSQTDIQSGRFQQMMGQHGCCCLSVATRDSNRDGLCKWCGKLDFRNYRDSFFDQFFHDCRFFFGNSGAFHHQVGIQNQVFRMLSFLPSYSINQKNFFVIVFYFSKIGHKNIISFFLAQNRGSNAAFAST